MDTILLIGLTLVLFPLSFVAGERVPRRGRLALLLFLALVSATRFVELVRVGGRPVATLLFAVLAVAFVVGAWRHNRQKVVAPGD